VGEEIFALEISPNIAEAHSNLGITLKELGRLDEAEASYRQAIALKPDFAEAHSNLGVILYINGDIDSGLESLKKAHNIDPDLHSNQTILTILQARKARGKTEVSADNISNLGYSSEQFPQPVILNRAIEAELITSLYKMKSIELDKFDNSRISDPRFGDGKCSRDFKLFKDVSPIIKSVAEDLIIIMREVVKSDIYITESFFNIFGAGGGTTPHTHISKLYADEYLNFGKQKYSLVYYLSVGDQNCRDQGILKLYDPSEDILPCEGMIAIFPADRKHSAVYGGETDRVMIGNF
jgi:tetratricopeptide (TPR) repeat protein